MTTGPCGCWPTRWWSWDWRRRCPMRRYASSSKNVLKPWRKQQWCIPKVNGEFVAAMEDVLDLYAEPYDPDRPVVCFDETSTHLRVDSGRGQNRTLRSLSPLSALWPPVFAGEQDVGPPKG